MRLFRVWESFWGVLGFLRRNRRQRKAATAKRRSLRRRHRMDALEQRVVLNADAVDDSLTTTYQSPVVFSAALLTSNDSGNGALTVTLPSSTIGGGTLSDDGNGNYTYTPVAGFSGTDSFTYTLNDEDPSADAATVSIQVGAPPTNTSPHADNAVFELRVPYGSGGGYFDLSGYIPQQGTHYGDSDGDGLTLTYGGYGWTYVSPGQQYSSSYSIDDGRGGSASATVFINIVEDYAPPSIPGGPYAIGEDTTLSLQTTNPSGKPLSLSVVSGPSHGSLALDAAGQIIYTPEANYFGTDSFCCSVSDGQRTSYTESVTVEIQSVDDAPAATSDAFTVPEDGSVSFTAGDLIGNDSDAESSVTFVRIVQSPTNGTLAEWGSGNSTQFAYTPAANYCGGDSFIYEIVDGTGNLAQATAWINVTPVNDSPVAFGDDGGTMSEDGSLVVRPSDWLVNDSDDEGVPTLLDVSASTGTLVANGDGSYTFTPPENFTGTTSLIYMTADSQGLTGSAAVTITVTPVNDAPTATGGAQAITEGSPLTLSSYDVDGDALLSAQVTLGPSYGNVTFADGTLTYTPSDPDYFGSDAFEYAVFDGQEWSSTVHVDVTVAPVNDAPTISVPTAQQLTTTGGMLVFSVAGDNSLAVGDVETGTKRLTLAVDRGQLSYGAGTPAQSLIISGDVAQLNAALEGLRFHAPANYAGSAALTICIDDQDATGGGPLTAAATVSLRVQPTISIADATNSETAGALEFTVTLSQAGDQDVTVAWQTQPDTADAADFTPASGTLTIAAGQTTGTITVALTNDGRDEDDQTFQLHLSNAVNGGLADAAAIGLIHDDEDAPLVYVVSREVREADGTVQVVVRLSNPSEKPVQVEWHPYDGSAIRGTDGNSYDWTQGNWTPPYSQQEYLDQGGYQDVWMESTGWHPVWIPDQYGDVWVDTSHYGDVLVSSGYWNYNVWVDTSHYGDVWVDTSHWGDVWVPNLVNEPILIDDQLDEYGNVITPGYWQDNWVDHGSYQYQLITEGHNEWQWITEGHYEDQWVDMSHYEYQWITEGHFENQVVIPAHTESQWTTIGWYQQQWVSNWQWTTVGYAGYWTDGGVLNFAPGVTEQAAEVVILNDSDAEGDENFSIQVSNPSNGVLGSDSSGNVTIRASDHPVTVTGNSVNASLYVNDVWTWTRDDLLVAVGANDPDGEAIAVSLPFGSLTYGTLTDDGNGAFSYRAASQSGSESIAITLTDLDGFTQSVTLNLSILPNVAPQLDPSSVTPPAPIVEDVTAEENPGTLVSDLIIGAVTDVNDEQFGIAIHAVDLLGGIWQYDLGKGAGWTDFPAGLTTDNALLLSADASTRVRYLPAANYHHIDGQADPTLAFRAWDRSNAAAGSLDGTLADASTYGGTSPYSNEIATVALTVTPDDITELPTLTGACAPVSESDGNVVVTLTLSQPLDHDVVVAWNTADRTARAGVDYVAATNTLTFLAGQTTAQITIGTLNDSLDEDDKSFALELNGPEDIAIENSAIEVTIADDDASPSVSIADTTANEATGFAEFTVTLSTASDRVVFVDWATVDGTAGAGDFVADNGRLAFAPGETSRKIVVDLVNDEMYEANKTFQVVLSNPTNSTIVGSPAATADITNDDAPPTIRVVSTSVDENDGPATIIVELSRPSESIITVDWLAIDGTAHAPDDYAADVEHPLGGTLTFVAGVTQQSIILPIIDDTTAETDESIGIELSNADSLYPTADGTLTIRDDERVRVTIADQEFDESAGVVGLVVTVQGATTDSVTVNWAVVDDTALEGIDFELVKPHLDENDVVVPGEWDLLTPTDLRMLTFVPGQPDPKIYVRILDNTVFDGDRQFRVQLSAPSNANVQTPASDITILDNEAVPSYLSDIGVTSENFRTTLPSQTPAPPPPAQAPDTSVPAFPPAQVIDLEVRTRADAEYSVETGLLKNLTAWQREHIRVVAGTIESEDHRATLELSADGSFVFVAGRFDIPTGATEVEDSFQFELLRSDGTRVQRTASFTLYPKSPDIDITVPDSLVEGEHGSFEISVGDNDEAVQITGVGFGPDLSEGGLMPADVVIDHPEKLDEVRQVLYLPETTIQFGFLARNNPHGYSTGSVAAGVTAYDPFWGTTTFVEKVIEIHNAPPQLVILEAPSAVNEGQPFLVKGRIDDAGSLDGHILELEFQGANGGRYYLPVDGEPFHESLPVTFPAGEFAGTWAWNPYTREFILELTAWDESGLPEGASNDLKFTLHDDADSVTVTHAMTVNNLPPRLGFEVTQDEFDSSLYHLNAVSEDDGDPVGIDVVAQGPTGEYYAGPMIDFTNGWHGTATAYDDDGGATSKDFSVPGTAPAIDPPPTYDVTYDLAAFLAKPDPDTKETINPTIKLYAIDQYSGPNDGIAFAIESHGGQTNDPDREYLKLDWSLRKKATGEEIQGGTSLLSYEDTNKPFLYFNQPDGGPSWRPDWDSEVELVITKIDRIVYDTAPIDGEILSTTPSVIAVGTENYQASAWILGKPVAETISINLTQDPSRNPESIGVVGEGAVTADVREGTVRLAFDPSGLSFTPTYIGGEQRFPVAIVETKLPVTAGGTNSIQARLIIAGDLIDADPASTSGTAQQNYADIVGGMVTFTTDGTISKDDLLHFAIPLTGANLDSLGSGHHNFYVEFTVTDSGGEHKLTQQGEFTWQNRFDSAVGQNEFGDGWAIPGLSSLIYTSDNSATNFKGSIAGTSGITLLNGDGTSEWYRLQTVGYGDFSTEVGGSINWDDGLSDLEGRDEYFTAFGLEPGKLYEISVHWLPRPDATTSAQFEVEDGRAVLSGRNPKTRFVVDQSIGGKVTLGLFTPDESGVIRIKLTGDESPLASSIIWRQVVPGAGLNAGASDKELILDANPSALDSGLRLRFADADGMLRQFDFAGRLREIRDLNDNRVVFSYYGDQEDDEEEFAGLLKTVTEQGGLTTTYTYSGRYLDKIKDFADREVDYLIMGEELEEIKGVAPGLGSQQPITKFDYYADSLLKEIERTVSTGTNGVTQTITIGRDAIFHRVTTVTISDTATTASWSFMPIVVAAFYGDAHHVLAPADNHIGSDAEEGARKEVQGTYVDTTGSTWIYQTEYLGYVTALAKPKVYAFNEATGAGFKLDSQHPENNVVVLKDEVWTWSRDVFGKAFQSVQPTVDASGQVRCQETIYVYDGVELKGIHYYEPDSATGSGAPRATEDWVYENVTDPETGLVIARKLKEHRAFFDVQAGEPASARLITKYVTDDRGNILTETGPDGSLTTNQYTYKPHTINDLAGGLVDLSWDAVHGTTDYVYYGQSSTSLTDEERRRIGLVKEITYAKGLPDEAKESFTYDDNRNLDKQTDIYGIETDYDYDNLDRLAKATHAATADTPALVETTVIDGLGNVVRSIQSAGYSDPLASSPTPSPVPSGMRTFLYETTFSYDALERLKKIRDVQRNATTEFEYSNIAGGQMETVTTPAAGNRSDQLVTKNYYDARGNLTATVHEAAEFLLNFDPALLTYDATTNSWTTPPTTSDVLVEYSSYDQAGNIQASWTSKSNRVADESEKTEFEYDSLGRMTKSTSPDPDGIVEHDLSLPSYGVSLSRPVTEYTYAADGRLLQAKSGSESAPSVITTEYRRYDGGRTETVEDAIHNITYREFDLAGRLTYEVDARSNVTQYRYDRLGRLTSMIDAAGSVTTIEYFDKNETSGLTEMGLEPDTRAERFEKVTDPRTFVTWKEYDAAGNLIRVVHPDPDGDRSDLRAISDVYAYNSDGTLAKQWQEYGNDTTPQRWKAYEYDAAGRLKRAADVLGTLAEYDYDRLDNVIRTENSNGAETFTDFDRFGRVVSTQLTVGGLQLPGTLPTRYAYDYLGNTTYQSDEYCDRTYTLYDYLGRPVDIVEPDVSHAADVSNYRTPKQTIYEYNEDGTLFETRGSEGITRYGSYDLLGRAKSVTTNFGTAEARETKYEFDEVGNVTKMVDADHNVTKYEYDQLNRVTKEWINIDLAKESEFIPAQYREWTYDGNGNLKSFRDRDDRVTFYNYDRMNRRTSVDSKGTNGRESQRTEFAYTLEGDLLSATSYAHSQETHKVELTSQYVYSNYDARGRVGKITQDFSVFDVQKQVVFDYVYSSNGYSVTASSNGFIYKSEYRFDAAGREIFASQTRPNAGNYKEITRQYFLQNGPQPSDSNVTPYAARRNQLTRTQKMANGKSMAIGTTTTYYEDQDSNLVRRIDHAKSNGAEISNFQYNYDAKGNLRAFSDHTGLHVVPTGSVPGESTAPYNRVRDFDLSTTPGADTSGVKYDLEGHVTAFLDEGYTNDHNYVLTWESDDRLVLSTKESTATQYAYDAFGNLIAVKTGDETRLSFYEGDKATVRFTATNSTVSPAPSYVAFYSATGELEAVDQLYPNGDAVSYGTFWTLNDADGSVRDVVTVATFTNGGPQVIRLLLIDYADGKPAPVIVTGGFGRPPELDANLQIYKGQLYRPEISGYYDGQTWTSTFVQNRTLSQVAGGTGNRYGAQDLHQVGYWSNIRNAASQAINQASLLDATQALLDVGGMLPGVGIFFDAASAGFALGRRDWVGLGLSIPAMVPFAGDATAGVAKLARWGIKIADNVSGAAKLGSRGATLTTKATSRLADAFTKSKSAFALTKADDVNPLEIARRLPDNDVISKRSFNFSNDADGNFVMRIGGCFTPDTLVLLPVQSELVGGDEVSVCVGTAVAINSVALGSRVLGDNPRPEDIDTSFDEPDPANWVSVQATVRKSDGALVEMEFLRPRDWAISNGIVAGTELVVSRPELKLHDIATIRSVGACPPIVGGNGHVVTGRFISRNITNLVRLRLADETTIEVTDTHLFWSLDREDWIPTGALQSGELLDGITGPIAVAEVVAIGYAPDVYNLEVHGQHVFRVANPGVLVHNTTEECVGGIVAPANRGLTFVGENLGTPRNAAMRNARDFEAGTIGAFSDVASRQRMAPALRFDNPKPNGASFVKFDGYQQLDNGITELIDSKTRLVPFSTRQGPFISDSVRDGLVRKSLAIQQNEGFRAVLEFPTATARREAQQVLRQLGITNISTRVRP